jgi:hypothetical protein
MMRMLLVLCGLAAAGCAPSRPATPAQPLPAAPPHTQRAASPAPPTAPGPPPAAAQPPAAPPSAAPPPGPEPAPEWYSPLPQREGVRLRIGAMADGPTISAARDAAVAAGMDALRAALGREPRGAEVLKVQVSPGPAGYRAYLLASGE